MAVAQDDDPLTLAMAPPPDETPAERAERERKEHEALQRSRQIDVELKNAKAALKRHKRAIRVLVLGQSLSGTFVDRLLNCLLTRAQASRRQLKVRWRFLNSGSCADGYIQTSNWHTLPRHGQKNELHGRPSFS